MRNAAAVAALGLVAAALLGGGGSGTSRLLWVGGLALVAAAAAYAVLGARPSRAGLALLGSLAALAFWDGLSIVWSVAPDLSWYASNRTVVYLGFALLGVVVAVSAQRLAAGLTIALAAVVGWALLTKVFPGLYPDYGRIARLRSPIGYWNALAQVGDALLPLGLWVFGRRRPEGAVAAYAASVAVVLTFSRTGVAFGAVATVLYLALAPEAALGVVGLVCALVPAGVVLGVAAALPGIVSDGQGRSVRAHDGWIFALVALAGAGASWVLARRALRIELSPTAGRRLVVGAGTVAAVAAVAGAAVLVVHAGGAARLLDEFTNTPEQQINQTVNRFGSVNSSNRWSWWQEAWAAFRAHPAGGSGAGSFPIEHRIVRTSYSQPAEEPHSLPLQFLGETGIVGFLLLATLVGSAVLILRDALRRDDRAAVAALAAGCAAYLLHTLVDLHWDYLAVSAPVFFTLGSLGGTAAERRRGVLVPAAVALVAAAAVYSLASPYLANRKLDAVAAALDAGRVRAAYEDARAAHRLNPLAIDPLVTEGYAAPQLSAGEKALIAAVKLQPDNPDAWVALGEYELENGRNRRAYDALNRAYTLDRYNPSAVRGGSLDRARCAIDPATCRG
jgi:O-antigen ligase